MAQKNSRRADDADCPDWPPPLPSLPPYPPCVRKPKKKEPPPPPPVEIKNSSHQEWWDEYLGAALERASGIPVAKKSLLYDLTRRQRRELLPVKIPTKQDRLIWSIPLPEGSYPPNGLPIWERLYLDHPLPMLRAPPNALVFARQQIGKKLWKDTEGQEFILYDPQGYEVQFSYENVHDPHLTNYYRGSEIRGFLLSMGDANTDGWGICTLKRFNQYRKYLRRVHISLVHKEMEYQDTLQDELHRVKMYRQITKETMEQTERKAMIEEAGAAIREALRQERLKHVEKLTKNIQDKERRIRRLYRRRAKEQEQRIKKGQRLQGEQELKKKISDEINRRKKIQTLRRWHESDEKRMKLLRKMADEKARQKAEKVRLRWQNKIDNLRKMFACQDMHLELQAEIKAQNIELRNERVERIKQKELEQFQELKKRGIMKKAAENRAKEDAKMSKAIMSTWLDGLETGFDPETEVYRVKKSINSTMAELLSQDTEGPDRFSIIAMARNRIQREQSIPLQVSFAIEFMLETAIETWAFKRVQCLVETVVKELWKHGRRRLEELKIQNKDIGILRPRNFKSQEPKGIIFKKNEESDKVCRGRNEPSDSSRTTLAETEIKGEAASCDSKKEMEQQREETEPASREVPPEITKGVIVSYVHFGLADKYEYEPENDVPFEAKPLGDRPKTPMPTQIELCKAGFAEERLKDVLPTISDVVELKEKGKFRKLFKSVAVQLFKQAMSITEHAYDHKLRIRQINKLIYLGDIERQNVVRTLCSLIMNKTEKTLYECEDFVWVTKVVAREVINDILKPPEFLKVPNDVVARTKIMFYKPREKKRKDSRRE